MTTRVTIEVPGPPVAKGRPRFRRLPTGAVIAYSPAETQSYERRVRLAAMRAMNGASAMLGPVSIRLSISVDPPKGWSGKKRALAFAGKVFPTKRPDADNILKGVLDGMNGVVFKDDSQITDLIITKRFAAPGIRAVIAEIEEAEAA